METRVHVSTSQSKLDLSNTALQEQRGTGKVTHLKELKVSSSASYSEKGLLRSQGAHAPGPRRSK
jgi:hypothetical protein